MTEGLEIGTPVASAAALAVLWTLEGVIPMFSPARGRWRDRMHNLAMAAINSAATGTMFAALTLVGVEWARRAGFGVLRWTDAPAWVVWIVGLIAIDLAYYGFHVLAHHWGWLWRFHVVHHHDTAVDVTSAVRFHVGEIAMQCVAMVGVYVVLGVGMAQVLAYQLILIPLAMFHHANIVMPERVDRALRLVVVTPRMHWVHHSRWQPETDSNYSGVLSVWDRVFGTFRLRRDPRTIEFGLDGFDEGYSGTLVGMIATPFGEAHAGPGTAPRGEEVVGR